jgi:pyruvate dehydrogenase E2 component (dihydrolipoamide acetyltransferase)
MTVEFKLPLISEGVEAADIAAVHVHEGDVVEAGQIVLEVETEKAVAEIPAPQSGRIGRILVKQGQTVKIGELLLTIDEAGPSATQGTAASAAAADPPAPATSQRSASPPPAAKPASPQPRTEAAASAEAPPKPAAPSPKPVEATAEAPAQQATAPTVVTTRTHVDDNGHEGPPLPAGPATRRLARELGVDLHRVSGTGPGGRITTDDVQTFVRSLTTTGRTLDVTAPMAAPTLPPFDRFGPIERQPMNKLARVSAANLSFAWQTIPHVTQHELADVTGLEEARQSYMKTIGQNGPKVTMTAIMVKAVVGALKAFPKFNSSIDTAAGELVVKRYYHIGVAVDTEFGLVVPVIRDADRKTVLTIAAELAGLARKARDRKLDVADMQGGTFTITNLGGIGGTSFTPLVNYPEAAVLGLSRTQTQVKLVDGKLVERLMLPLSLSYDHRIVNGADAARFVVKLSAILSDCFQLLIEC